MICVIEETEEDESKLTISAMKNSNLTQGQGSNRFLPSFQNKCNQYDIIGKDKKTDNFREPIKKSITLDYKKKYGTL